jgi:ABC-type glycerol-3-phosphate transport system substrate-binding protein
MKASTPDRPRLSAVRFAVALGLALGVAGATASQASAKKYQDKNEHWWCEFDNANGGSIDAGPFNKEPDCTHVCNNYANGTNCANAVKAKKKGLATVEADQIKEPVAKE